MKTVRGVKKYAKQFLKDAKPEDVPQAIEEFNAIASLMERDRNFRNFLVSPMFSDEEKDQGLVLITQKAGMPLENAKYLIYLSHENVLHALSDIARSIAALYDEMKKRVKAVVTSPVEISEEYEGLLAKSLRQVTGKDIDLEVVMDPSLLGGVRIQVGSTMYDSSLRGQLGLLRDKLIKG